MPKYSEIKNLLKDDDFVTEVYIPFNYIVSAVKDDNSYGLPRAEYFRLKCSLSNQTSNPINRTYYNYNSIEYFLNGLLEGK
ncbi:Uncharacterised protein [uncultured Clostridium sp.]|nr:Uncharacterised protein [uncultured Clostridium sp.]SCJ45703.1 Uncharacterised protein [uncultured Clostridium sp.]